MYDFALNMEQLDKELFSKQAGLDGKIEVTFEGNIAVIHMGCGENRFNLSFLQKMNEALDKVESNPAAEVLITTSDGKFYSNGYDLNWIALLNFEQRATWIDRDTFALIWRFMTFPLPTIAAINGHAFALGAFWTLAHDYILMNSEKGWWCFNEVHNNFLFPDFFKSIFRERLHTGPTLHKAAVMGHRYTGNELAEAGVAYAACPAKEIQTRAKELAKSLVKRGAYNREALQNMKSDIYQGIKVEVDKAIQICKQNKSHL